MMTFLKENAVNTSLIIMKTFMFKYYVLVVAQNCFDCKKL